MSPAAGPAILSDRCQLMPPAVVSPPSPANEMVAKDAILTWYRGEFAAANAIIDALCNHITQLSDGYSDRYEEVFTAIHRRRLNWIPVLQMQKYFSVSDVAHQLRKVVETKKMAVKTEEVKADSHALDLQIPKIAEEDYANCDRNASFVDEDSPDSDITDAGSQEVHVTLEPHEICDNHGDCGSRREQIKITKGFVAKEPVKGHMVNVVKGLKMFEDIFTDGEKSRLNEFVDQLRSAGQNGQLLGETYILFNKQVKGSKREQVQLGVPIFGHVKDESMNENQKTNIEPIPDVLQSVTDHLVQWHIIPESRKPNGCIINYFDEGEYSQPYLKPPHLDQPICTLLLSDSTLAFGRTLVNDGEGNFKGNLMLSVREGSVLVMRNHSADMARHAMCTSPTKRASITFYRVRPARDHNRGTTIAPLTQAMTMWQPGIPSPCSLIPEWGVIHAPVMKMSPGKVLHGGTGVFLPWGVRSRKPARHLPPRAQKGRLHALPLVHTPDYETMSDPGS